MTPEIPTPPAGLQRELESIARRVLALVGRGQGISDDEIRAELRRLALRLTERGSAQWATFFRGWVRKINNDAVGWASAKELFPDLDLDGWVEENLRLITGLAADVRERVATSVGQGITQGLGQQDLAKLVRKELGIGQRRARLIARDQTAKFNGALNKATMQRAGIDSFRWITVGPSARPSHRALHGKVFRWDDLPLVDGERTYPGRPIQCRCTAYPVDPDLEGLPQLR